MTEKYIVIKCSIYCNINPYITIDPTWWNLLTIQHITIVCGNAKRTTTATWTNQSLWILVLKQATKICNVISQNLLTTPIFSSNPYTFWHWILTELCSSINRYTCTKFDNSWMSFVANSNEIIRCWQSKWKIDNTYWM